MTQGPPAPDSGMPPLPLGQRLFDNIYLLLVAGIVVMAVLYTGWGDVGDPHPAIHPAAVRSA